jgi:tetratricopeptide (TPR) repeat protein
MHTPGFGSMPMNAHGQAINRVKQLVSAGQFDSAVGVIEPLLKSDPRNPDLLRLLGFSLLMTGFAKQGQGHLRFASQLRPGDPEILCDLSVANRWLGKTRDAYQAIDLALKSNPGHARALSTKARLLQSHGQSQQAIELLSDAMESTHNPSIAVIYAQLCRELKQFSAGIDALKPFIADPSVQRSLRCEVLFAYGHLLDAVEDYDAAFQHFALANAMGDEGGITDFGLIKETWSPHVLAQIPAALIDTSRAVLVMGMPRSGTTLTEQIIAAHPAGDSVGESPSVYDIMYEKTPSSFDQEGVSQAASVYMQMLDTRVPDSSIKRVCDKMPENYMHLGAISRFLPNAKIIHSTRNARDTCLSIYFQNFASMIRYARDIEMIAKQYLGYLDLMEYWNEHLGIDILDSSYEDLTANPDKQIKVLIEHIGLPFDQACLEFHASKKTVNTASATQVRQPLYQTSTHRWKHYEKHLGPMLEVLGDL